VAPWAGALRPPLRPPPRPPRAPLPGDVTEGGGDVVVGEVGSAEGVPSAVGTGSGTGAEVGESKVVDTAGLFSDERGVVGVGEVTAHALHFHPDFLFH